MIAEWRGSLYCKKIRGVNKRQQGSEKLVMKNFITAPRALIVFCLATVLAGSSTLAQSPGGAPGMGAAMVQLFGENTSFTAKANTDIKGAEGPGNAQMIMDFTMLEGKTRVEIDLTTMKADKFPPGAADQLKKMGMEKVVSISRPDKKINVVVYPGLEAYAEIPMEQTEISAVEGKSKFEKTSIGKETIDGHACNKNKATITDPDGKKHESILWNATDLKDFPVQLQMTEGTATVLIKFTDVKLVKPDAKLFEAPAAFKKYTGIQEMMQAEMMKRMGGGLGQ